MRFMNKRLLLIEDNPISLEFLHEALQLLELKVDKASDLATANVLAQQFRYDLLLCDVHLPDAEAEEILCTLREYQTDAMAIAITAEASAETREGLLRMAYEEVWLKPITIAQLHANVTAALTLNTSATVSTAELWDEAAGLRAVAGNQKTLNALREMFMTELPRQERLIAQAFQDNKPALIVSECHKLLASCGFVGASSLSESIQRLSRQPNNGAYLAKLKKHIAQYFAENR